MNGENIDIILIEDDPNDARLIMRVFKKHNLTNNIVHLEDGAKALEYLFDQENHSTGAPGISSKVILLDLKLPKVNGIEVLRRLKEDERTRSIPVVILTSSNEEKDIDAAYALGVNSYVTKPIKFDDFASVVTDLGFYWMLLNKLPART